jgi:transposase
MAEHEEQEQQEAGAPLRHLTKTDPDPRVRRRAHAVSLAEEGQTLASVARLFHTSAYRVHVWQERFAAEGRAGLLDRPRGGRPHALSDADRAFLEAALECGPQAYDLPMTVWSIRDLQVLLERERGVVVSVDTVHRAVHALGFRSRRPRHDLTHRQDREAVAAAKHVLDWLQKKQLLSPSDPLLSASIWSTWTNAKSTPIRTWRKSGGARGSP